MFSRNGIDMSGRGAVALLDEVPIFFQSHRMSSRRGINRFVIRSFTVTQPIVGVVGTGVCGEILSGSI